MQIYDTQCCGVKEIDGIGSFDPEDYGDGEEPSDWTVLDALQQVARCDTYASLTFTGAGRKNAPPKYFTDLVDQINQRKAGFVSVIAAGKNPNTGNKLWIGIFTPTTRWKNGKKTTKRRPVDKYGY